MRFSEVYQQAHEQAAYAPGYDLVREEVRLM
jgi:hypothetical protein